MRKMLLIAGLIMLCSFLKAQPPVLVGGEFKVNKTACLTSEERERIKAALKVKMAELNLTKTFVQNDDPVKFIWPVVPAPTNTDTGTWGISNYVDHDAAYPNKVKDYNCGTRTYDTDGGYNHQGIDIYTWPFGQFKQLNSEVHIVAAAAGVIIAKGGSQPDNNCSFCTTACQWNAVYLRHNNGSVTWYGHMKTNSLTTKPVGATVAEGEFLGVIGSSGNSTGPHLHFEVYENDTYTKLVDPYAGSCNTMNGTTSWWKNQRAYNKPTINLLQTHFAPPVMPACPGVETLNDRNVYKLTDTVYYAAYLIDQLSGNSMSWRLFRPDGTQYAIYNQPLSANYYSSYWYIYWILPNNTEGYWRIELTYNSTGQVAKHTFYRGNNPPVYSLKQGNWHDGSTWSTGVVPAGNEEVFIQHHIEVNGNATCKSLRIGEKGRTIVKAGVQLDVLK